MSEHETVEDKFLDWEVVEAKHQKLKLMSASQNKWQSLCSGNKSEISANVKEHIAKSEFGIGCPMVLRESLKYFTISEHKKTYKRPPLSRFKVGVLVGWREAAWPIKASQKQTK